MNELPGAGETTMRMHSGSRVFACIPVERREQQNNATTRDAADAMMQCGRLPLHLSPSNLIPLLPESNTHSHFCL